MLPAVILGLFVLAGGILLVRGFVSADPKALARLLRILGIVALVAAVVFLALVGRLGLALTAAAFLLPFLLRWRAVANRVRAARGPAPGQSSGLDTVYLHVELDHDTGRMSGAIRHGPFAGRALDSLSPDELRALLDDCRRDDPPSAAVLEAYLDRMHGPAWREQDAAPAAPAADGAMTREEAYGLLGLQPGAGADEIRAAHRRLMKKFHPDQGGSDYIAAKLNQAKDLLLDA